MINSMRYEVIVLSRYILRCLILITKAHGSTLPRPNTKKTQKLSFSSVRVGFSRVQLYDPMDCNPPDSSVHGILQARILEWVAISHSSGSSLPMDPTLISCFSCISRWVLYYWYISNIWFFKFFSISLFIWLLWVLVGPWGSLIFAVTCSIFSCGVWDIVSWPGLESRSPSQRGAQSHSHQTNRKVSQ